MEVDDDDDDDDDDEAARLDVDVVHGDE